jgi:hypothetical protein
MKTIKADPPKSMKGGEAGSVGELGNVWFASVWNEQMNKQTFARVGPFYGDK